MIAPWNKLTVFMVLFFISDQKKLTAAVASTALCAENDDYCDCGHDELLSSACSFYSSKRSFYCRDQRFYNQSLFPSRVGDGICDCCDGSDEIHGNTPIVCPNVCDIVGSAIEKEATSMRNSRAQGISERGLILATATAKLNELRIGLRKAQMLIPKHRKLIYEYKNQLIKQSSLESLEFENIYQSSVNSFRRSLLIFSDGNIQKLLAVITLLVGSSGVESILVDCDGKYETDGPDPDDLKAFSLVVGRSCPVDGNAESSTQTAIRAEEMTNDIVESMINALALARLSTESLVTVFQHAVHRVLEENLSITHCFEIANVTVPSPILIESIKKSPASLIKSDYKIPEAEQLRLRIGDLNAEITLLLEGAEKAKSLGNSSYGPDNSLFTLRDQCLSHKEREHNYEICIFEDVRQGSVLVGTFDKVEVKSISPLSLERADGIITNVHQDKEAIFISYINGGICYGTKTPRNMIIKLECGSGDARISEIDEVEMCSYTAKLITPLACA